ncbi:MAG: hypothetical protein ABI585_00585 [Betaproteobacteria bacterium]
MNFDSIWILALGLAVVSLGGMIAMMEIYRRRHVGKSRLEHKEDLRSWENEGGNVANAPMAPAVPPPVVPQP